MRTFASLQQENWYVVHAGLDSSKPRFACSFGGAADYPPSVGHASLLRVLSSALASPRNGRRNEAKYVRAHASYPCVEMLPHYRIWTPQTRQELHIRGPLRNTLGADSQSPHLLHHLGVGGITRDVPRSRIVSSLFGDVVECLRYGREKGQNDGFWV